MYNRIVNTLDSIAKDLEREAAIKGAGIFIDDNIDNERNLYVVVNDKGIIGAFGLCKDCSTEDNGVIFMFLDRSKIKYLFDEGFCTNDFYKIMGEKLFITVDKEEFYSKILEK